MKRLGIIFLLLNMLLVASAQTDKSDSLKKALTIAKDTMKVIILNQLAEQYLSKGNLSTDGQKDSILHIALLYATDAESYSRSINYTKGLSIALFNAGNITISPTRKNYFIVLPNYLAALPLLKQTGDEQRVAKCLMGLGDCYHMVGKPEKGAIYYDSAKNQYLSLKDTLTSIKALGMKGHCYYDIGNYKKAYELGMETLKLAEQTNNTNLTAFALAHLANLFLGADLPQTVIEYMHKILALYPHVLEPNNHDRLSFGADWGLLRGGEAFLKLNQVDSAIMISKRLVPDSTDSDNQLFYGLLYKALHQNDKALGFFLTGLKMEKDLDHPLGIARHANEVGQIYLLHKNFKLAAFYADEALTTAQRIPALLEIRNAVGTLKDISIETKNYQEVYRYSSWYKLLSDSIAPDEYRQRLSIMRIQSELDNQKQQALLLIKENEIKEQQLSKGALLRNFFIAGILVLLMIAAIVFRNNRQKHNANILLVKQKKEIQDTLLELKSTQAQLIQSAKMASLGELTAGIAHEIQNPLNFVNNFSEVSNELVTEMKDEMAKGNYEDANDIANDVQQNLEKINHHGKRAAAIVKGMLQHSRSSSGVKEPTDINALCDECLRLSFHGLRAKDKSFNATIKTDFDESIGKINTVPQDIGRVILNLLTNAFYAVNEKNKSAIENYEPTVSLTTKKIADKVSISISDNGPGIPQNIVDKIFQPFFTTKPTGQGTGLGLSLSFDIITKGHGGELKVETKEGEGLSVEALAQAVTTFKIILPIV